MCGSVRNLALTAKIWALQVWTGSKCGKFAGCGWFAGGLRDAGSLREAGLVKVDDVAALAWWASVRPGQGWRTPGVPLAYPWRTPELAPYMVENL